MKRLAILICCVFLLGSASAYAQQAEVCPWLNRATAAGVLGGEVRMVVSHPEHDTTEQINGAPADATCEFTRVSGGTNLVLRIAVHTMQHHASDFGAYLATCGSDGSRMVGVGNHAVKCVVQHGANGATEQVVARVRERAFVLTWTMPKAKESPAEKDQPSTNDRLQNLAEQVAGSLF